MTTANLRRVKTIFVEAIERSGTARLSYLESACGSDAALRAEVEALLRVSEGTNALAGGENPWDMSDPGADEDASIIMEGPGARIGRYKLLEQIGQGGFGVVFMAEQEEPVRRKLALKVIKLGMDTRQVIARFEAERQTLAMMDHPNIAKVFDAGSTQAGRPYFVMELVKGVPFTEFCDENHLDMRERLELFVQVCHAVQHAHQKGIIHRDLKPGNILVTMHDDKPVPKVIDFGIAKATQARLTDKTLFTEFRQFMGTPQYTSPEQVQMSGLDVDTRSDIYSLGVILYELLTGTTPLDPRELRSAGMAEVQRLIRETEPPRPSARLGTMGQALVTVAAQRKVDSRRLPRIVRGELDWIVLKCLEKDRTRRYESASDLASDVHRYLDDEPILARPPSARYRTRKFIRRHTLGFAFSAAMVALLVLGVIGTTIGMLRARAARQVTEKLLVQVRSAEQDAEREADKAKATTDFLQQMLSSARPSEGNTGRDVKVVDVLDRGAGELKRLSGQPEVEFDARVILGNTYEDLGLREQAREQLVRARALALQRYGPEANVTLGITGDLARVMARTGQSEPAELLCRDAVSIARKTFGERSRVTCVLLNNLGLVLIEREEYAEAETTFRALVRQAEQQSPLLRDVRPVWMNNLAVALRSQGKNDEAAGMVTQATDLLTQRHEADPVLRSYARRNLAVSLLNAGKLKEAEAAYREALADQRRSLGMSHPNTRLTASEYAALLERLGRRDEARTLRQELAQTQQSRPSTSRTPAETTLPAE